MLTTKVSALLKEGALVVCGLVLLMLTLPVGILSWLFLPWSDYYPAPVAGLPALPVLWLGLMCLKWAGLPIEEAFRKHPTGVALIVVGGSLLFMMAVASLTVFLDPR
jgi:hypothetical protein